MNDANPYQPPQSEVRDTEELRELVEASRGRRFGTFIVDYIGALIVVFVVSFGMVLVMGDRWIVMINSTLVSYLLGMGVMILYYVGFEAMWGRTPGKFVFGTVVVNEEGGPPSFGQVIGRTLCRFIPFEGFSMLAGRGWHDSIPRTYVIMAR
ncbi:putative RDD family membrane protein YckC [Povalibacter uvarum]|uniref:Putative RDD family membrane protein YckC n=1 Tax=Povalibacter uvarum TaxID=732238 RepID=A0A841HSK5_9GAMM|nr:RDD family protein [Povalibacter uvarum]MBB6096297.1 putative RDD family membrane protein YckC [Povalibacter uvarum]